MPLDGNPSDYVTVARELPTNDTFRALEKARAYMDEHGWCRGAKVDDAGRVCLLGAISKTGGAMFASLALEAVAMKRLGHIWYTDLNDENLTSKAQALAVFDEAISLERQRLLARARAVRGG